MSADDTQRRREAIDSVAADYRRATGGRMTQTEARERVERAARTGDAKRENGGR